MHEKRRTGTAVVREGVAQAALRRGPAVELAATEEKALRMRLGAGLPLSARLERLATATDTEIDLLAIEIEAYLRLGVRGAPRREERRAVKTVPSRAKEKIVRALRRKG